MSINIQSFVLIHEVYLCNNELALSSRLRVCGNIIS